MDAKKIISLLKKYWFSIIFYGIIALLIFSPSAKSWILQRVVVTGLLKADINKENLQAAGNFSFTDESGKATSIMDLKGKVVFINFWASWCPPCRAEMPDLRNLYEKLKDDSRFVFLFMNEDQDRNKAVEYLEKNNFSMPMYFKVENVPPEIFSGTLPTTVILNKKGEIVLKHSGMASYNSDGFIKQLHDLL
ncbi:MAG: TlpA disulfide reductase family protein, partial [Ginsengibacter sp.]